VVLVFGPRWFVLGIALLRHGVHCIMRGRF